MTGGSEDQVHTQSGRACGRSLQRHMDPRVKNGEARC